MNCVTEIEFDVFILESKNYKIFLVGGGAVKSFSACLASCRWPSKLHAIETQEHDGFSLNLILGSSAQI